MGAYTSWGAYMAANANGSISTVSILTIYPNLAAGYNMIFFTTPLDVQANYLISWSSEPGSGLLALDKDSAVIYPDYLYDGSSVSALSKTTPYRFYAHAITKYNYQIQQMEKAFAYPTSYNMSFVVSGTPGLTQAATVKADLSKSSQVKSLIHLSQLYFTLLDKMLCSWSVHLPDDAK